VTERSIYGTGGPRGRYNAAVACSDAPASTDPERPAIVQEAAGTVSGVTFGELASRSSALAVRLIGAGVGPGEPVGVFTPAGSTAAIAHLGVLKAGAVTVPLVPLLGEGAILHRLGDSGAGLVLATEELEDVIAPLLDRLPQDAELMVVDEETLRGADGATDFVAAPTSPEDPAILLHTSGTTGRAKGAVIPHRVILARQVPLSMVHGPFLPDDVFWTPADWMWVGSLIDCVLGPLSHGCTVMTYERRRFEPLEAIDRIVSLGVTRAFIPPTALRLLMGTTKADWAGQRLRSVHTGGERLSADADRWAKETLGITLDEIYGMTEASFLVGNAQRFSEIVPGSLGHPFPGQRVMLGDGDQQPVEPGEVGELLVAEGSPSLFLGYHGQPEATAERMRGGWFATGDLMRSDDAGRLYYVGRKDDLIITSGHRIGPSEIEDVLRTHRQVRDAIVVGESDAERGQRIKAVIQLHDGIEPSTALTPELQDLVRAQVGGHAYPRLVEYIAEYPRTATGKVRRDLLRLPVEERRLEAEPAVADR
jgi:acetyl-CoA synthetase